MLAYDADLELFRDNFRRFMQENIAPHYEQWEHEGIMPRSVWNALGENGFLCVDVPEEYGGYGVPIHYSLMLVEESARAGFCALATAISCHSEIAAPYILNIGSEEQKQYWLPKMVSGEVVGAIGMTEPGAGSDLQSMRSNAILQGDHYLLNGSKTFISNGQHADLVILAAKTDPQARAKGVSLLLVDTHLEGFKKGTNLNKIGLHSQDTSELFYDNVKVPKEQLLGISPTTKFCWAMLMANDMVRANVTARPLCHRTFTRAGESGKGLGQKFSPQTFDSTVHNLSVTLYAALKPLK